MTPLRDRTVLGINVAGAAACAVVLGVFCLDGLRPLLGRAAAGAVTHRRLAVARQRRAAADAAIADGTAELADLHRQTLANALVLLPPARVNDVLARVSTLAAACGVRLDEVRLGELARGDRYATLPVHAVGTGAYRDCVAFLHRLNHDCPDVGVAAVGLTAPAAADAAGGPIAVTLDLRWHAALPADPTPAR